MRELIDMFVRELPNRLVEIQHAYQTKQWGSLQSLSHKLKGIGTSFGFPEITEKAAILNANLKTNSMDNVDQDFADLEISCQAIIENYLPKHTIAV